LSVWLQERRRHRAVMQPQNFSHIAAQSNNPNSTQYRVTWSNPSPATGLTARVYVMSTSEATWPANWTLAGTFAADGGAGQTVAGVLCQRNRFRMTFQGDGLYHPNVESAPSDELPAASELYKVKQVTASQVGCYWSDPGKQFFYELNVAGYCPATIQSLRLRYKQAHGGGAVWVDAGTITSFSPTLLSWGPLTVDEDEDYLVELTLTQQWGDVSVTTTELNSGAP